MKKFKKMQLGVFLIYLIALGLAALASNFYPTESASFIHLFFPIEKDFSTHDFVRYRVLLWLVATIVLVIITPIIGFLGIEGMVDIERFKSFSSWYWFFLFPIMLISWLFYPIVFLCVECITGNNFVYFYFTIAFFIGLQVTIQTTILKIQFFLGFK